MNLYHEQNHAITLRDSQWAIGLFGYEDKSASAFWQFVHSNGVPIVRTGKRKIQFSETAVSEWLRQRSTGRSP